MALTLDPTQLADTRAALLRPGSAQLIELVFRLNLRRSPDGIEPEVFDEAIRLGWVTEGSHTLTRLGWLVADPIREYRFWLDRGRRLHGENDYDLLRPESYAGLSVLEPGSGFGCNLLSLSRVGGRFVGLEPVALYRQFTPIFAEREGLTAPEVVGGSGESLPFGKEEFDVVLCYSAHQYMDVAPALREMARVLRPGGQLQVIGGTLDVVASTVGRRVIQERSLGALKHWALTLGNTLSYELRRQRLFNPTGDAATGAPVYPRLRYMRQWMTEAGLKVRDDLTRRVGVETCFVADKPR